ncbi:MAG: hypothetical protein ACQERZ_03490 [Fusobacteriota bacterium]
MKQQRMNPNQMSQIDMMKNKSMMGMASYVQKLGKGKRKHVLKIEKHNKKMLGKLAGELKKQASAYGEQQAKGMLNFLSYLENEAKKKKKKELKVSFAELNFLKKTLRESLARMDEMEYKWYQFFRKWMMKLMAKQYRELLKDITK